jgi:hypothetical protein
VVTFGVDETISHAVIVEILVEAELNGAEDG